MQIKNVWAVLSDDGTELYDEEKEATTRAFEMIVQFDSSAVVDWFETLKLEEQQNLLYRLQGFDNRDVRIEKI